MTDDAVMFFVEVQPRPKQRPRVVNGRAHTPPATREYETAIGWAARLKMGPRPALEGDLSVLIHMARTGARRIDIDNAAKAILDGCNGIVWQDDAQIVALEVHIAYNADRPHVGVVVRRKDEQ